MGKGIITIADLSSGEYANCRIKKIKHFREF
jgi:hypothetical protein